MTILVSLFIGFIVGWLLGRAVERTQMIDALTTAQFINRHNQVELARMEKDHLCLRCRVAEVDRTMWPNEIKER